VENCSKTDEKKELKSISRHLKGVKSEGRMKTQASFKMHTRVIQEIQVLNRKKYYVTCCNVAKSTWRNFFQKLTYFSTTGLK